MSRPKKIKKKVWTSNFGRIRVKFFQSSFPSEVNGVKTPIRNMIQDFLGFFLAENKAEKETEKRNNIKQISHRLNYVQFTEMQFKIFSLSSSPFVLKLHRQLAICKKLCNKFLN